MAARTVVINFAANVGTILGKLSNVNAQLKQMGQNLQATQGFAAAAQRTNNFANNLRRATSNLFAFNTTARVGASSARVLGTSMIFAGGAFRELGVGINVAASLFQSFVPIIGGFVRAFGPASLLVVPFAANLLAIGAALVVVTAAMAKTIQRGVSFNAELESNTITVATLIVQYKDLADSQGKLIGVTKEYTNAELKSMTVEKQQEVIREKRNATTAKFIAAQSLARQAVVQLTATAADSVYTTKELLGAFTSTYSVLGKFGVSAKQAAGLTGTLARMASVAGVSAANLGSQITLFLSGAGRITSPLSRFAQGLGLSKDAMKAFSAELNAAKGNTEEVQKVINRLTIQLTAFDVGGRLMSDTWTGIMSNMEESFDLFAGAVSKGFFEKVRNAIFSIETDSKGAITRVSGVMSKIFNIDPTTGTFFTGLQAFEELFTEPLREAISSLRQLVSIIGSDLSSLIEWVGEKVIEISEWIGQNPEKIIEIYSNVKLVIGALLIVLKHLWSILGFSGDINKSVSTTNSYLTTTASILYGISFVINSATVGMYLFAAATYKAAAAVAKLNPLANFLEIDTYLDGLSSAQMKNADETTARMAQNQKEMADLMAAGNTAKNDNTLKLLEKSNEIANSQSIEKWVKDRVKEQSTPGYKKQSIDPSRMKLEQLEALRRDEIFEDLKAGRDPSGQIEEISKKGDSGLKSGASKSGGAMKKIREVAERIPSLFREISKVFSAALAFQETIVEQTYRTIRDRMSEAAEDLQHKFEIGEISFIELNKKSLELSLSSIEAEKKEREELNKLRLEAYEENLRNIQAESDEVKANFKAELAVADSASKRQSLTNKHANEQSKLALKLAEEKIDKQKEDIKYTNAKTELEIKSTREITKANNELYKLIKENQKERLAIEAEYESETGGDTVLRKLQIELELEEKLKKLAKEKADFEKANPSIALSDEPAEKLKKLADLQKLQLELSRQQLLIDIQRFQFDKDTEKISKAVSEGYLSERQGVSATADAAVRLQKATKSHYQTLLDIAEYYRQEGGAANQTRALDIEKQIEAWQKLSEVVDQAAVTMRTDVRAGFTTFFDEIATDVRNIGDAFTNLGKSIAGTFRKLISERLSEKLFSGLFGNGKDKAGLFGDVFGKVSGLSGLAPNAIENVSLAQADAGRGKLAAASGIIDKTLLDPLLDPTQFYTPAKEASETAKANFLEAEKEVVKIHDNVVIIGEIIDAATKELVNYADAVKNSTQGGIGERFGIGATVTSSPNALWNKWVKEAADKYKLPTELIFAQMKKESSFNPKALSKSGAFGLMQLMAGTASDLGVNRNDPKQNIFGGVKYLRQLIDRYKGDVSLGLAAYNWGMGNVDAFVSGKKKTMPKETREYAPTILRWAGMSGQGPGGTPKWNPDSKIGFKPSPIKGISKDPVEKTLSTIATETTQTSSELDTTTNPLLKRISDNIDIKLSDAIKSITDKMCPCPSAKTEIMNKIASGLTSFLTEAVSVRVLDDNAQGAASGGYIRGPGGPKSDKIPAWLSNGEYVIQAAAVKALGLDKLQMLNNAHKKAPKFAGGGLFSGISGFFKKLFGKGSSGPTATGAGGAMGNSDVMKWLGGSGGKGLFGGFSKSKALSALKGGAINAGISIGLALLGRLFAKKGPKSDPDRVKDPYGLNPETLTFYKKPIISGARNYLANGGLVTSSSQVMQNFPKFNTGGLAASGLEGMLENMSSGSVDNGVNIRQNININTPDIHSFRSSRAQVQRDLARVAQNGLGRTKRKY